MRWGSSLMIFCLFANLSSAQTTSFYLQNSDSLPRSIKFDQSALYEDSIAVILTLKKYKLDLEKSGFLTAGFENIQGMKDSISAKLYLGKAYKWVTLTNGNVPEEYLSKSGFRERLYNDTELRPRAFGKISSRLLKEAENSGFPFAELRLDSTELIGGGLRARLYMERNEYVRIDSLILKGGLSVNRNYLSSYLGIKAGMPYDQSALDKIPNRIRELPFVKPIKPYEVGMRPGKADVYLYLDSKKASNFDGILGVLPDSETGKTQITGDVQLNLLNSFRRGETIDLRWQRLQTGTQELDFRFTYPFIFNVPVGTDVLLNLYRRDTLFSQFSINTGLQYFFKGGNFAKVFYENKQANVIGANLLSIDQFVDSRINLFGVGLELRQLDYRFNPSRGYFINASIAAGVKEILENSDADADLYADIELESDIYDGNLEVGYYQPFGRQSTLLFRIRGGALLNENMFRNEIYRIGGLKSLRGFNEQAIFASSYAIGTIEYRFLFEQNSNFFVFFDQGIYEDITVDEPIQDQPFGFGGGINFETNAGVFSLTYALGKQFDNSIELRSGKIHFGFVSFF